jgi:hypothetical protein
MSVFLSPVGGAASQFFDNNGNVLTGGKIYTYAAGTTTPQTTYTSVSGNTAHTNPIILDAAGRVPGGELWLTFGVGYKFVLKTSTDVLIGTYDNVTGIISVLDAAQVTYTPAGTGAVPTNVQTKLRESVSVKDFGAVGNGVADDGAAIRLAIASVTANGGQVYFPAGTYKVTAASGDMSNTAIYVPSYVRLTGASQVGTKIIPGASNTVCFRVQGLNGGIENLQIDNPGSTYSNVSGIRLAPTDEAGTTVRSDVEFNNFTNLSIRRCSEAITLRPGPTVGGQDSYCYYNTFTNIDIRNCTRGIWLKAPPTQPGSGSNRNTFISCRIGETGTNTGLTIDAGDTCKFVACSFEGISTGTNPNAVPTAIQIAYNTATYGCTNNQFYGTVIEACTRDMDNDNDLTQMYGWFHTGTYYSPSSRTLVVDIQNTGLAGVAIGTNRVPTVQGDFFVNDGPSIVKASTGIGGQAEFRVDTGTAYGVYSFYAATVKKWSIGSISTGTDNLTFFNASDNVIGQFVAGSGGAFKPLQSASAPTYIKGAIYFDTSLNKLCVGGATAWETITSV